MEEEAVTAVSISSFSSPLANNDELLFINGSCDSSILRENVSENVSEKMYL